MSALINVMYVRFQTHPKFREEINIPILNLSALKAFDPIETNLGHQFGTKNLAQTTEVDARSCKLQAISIFASTEAHSQIQEI